MNSKPFVGCKMYNNNKIERTKENCGIGISNCQNIVKSTFFDFSTLINKSLDFSLKYRTHTHGKNGKKKFVIYTNSLTKRPNDSEQAKFTVSGSSM